MSLFVEFLIKIKPMKTHSLPKSTGKSLYGFLLNVIRKADPALSKVLHDYRGPKPFTVSRLIGKLEYEDGTAFISENQKYLVRFTSISELVSRAIIETLSPVFAKGETFFLWGEEFEILSFEVSSLNGYPSVLNMDMIINAAEKVSNQVDKAMIKFVSETAFRYKDRNILFPLPEVVFPSIWKRLISVAQIDIEEPKWAEKVKISRYDLKTSVANIDKIPFQGFKGFIELDFSSLEMPEIKDLLILCISINYLGIGTKTTMGMGQAYMPLSSNIKEVIF